MGWLLLTTNPNAMDLSPWFGVGGSAGLLGVAVLIVRVLWTRSEKLEQRSVQMMQELLDQERKAHEQLRHELAASRKHAQELQLQLQELLQRQVAQAPDREDS